MAGRLLLVLTLFVQNQEVIAAWKDFFLPKPVHGLSGQCQNETDKWIKSLEIIATVSIECITIGKCDPRERKIIDDNLYAAEQLDAWGQFPAPGLLERNTLFDGSYQECQRTSGKEYETNYCYLLLTTGKNASCDPSESTYTTLPLRFAVCLPYSCNEKDMIDIFNQMSPYPFTACKTYCAKKNVEKGVAFWMFSVFLMIVVFISIVASLLDFIRETVFEIREKVFEIPSAQEENVWIKVLLSFSFWTNAELVLSVKEQKPGFIKSLDCIRLFSMCWVVAGHTFLYLGMSDSMMPVYDFPKHLWNHLILNAFVTVDTFFVLSGIVAAYMFFKMRPTEKTVSSGSTWVLFYVHRYLRLTPPVMFFIGFFTVYAAYIQGSFSASQMNPTDAQLQGCYKYWWMNLLYINNFDHADNDSSSCYGITWYLAVDTQLYVMAPVFLLSLYSSFFIGTIVIVVACGASIIATYMLFGIDNLSADGFGIGNQAFFDIAYSKPWIRCPPYLVGMLTGYLLAIYGSRRIRLNWMICVVGWILAFGIAAACLFATNDYDKGAYWSPFARGTFYNFDRLGWAFFVCWVVGANHMGWGGPVNNFMSHPIWQPFGRLSYCAYIVHWMVLFYFLNLGGPMHYWSAWQVFLYTILPATLLSYVFAFFWSCLFEVPILKLEKMLIEKIMGKPRKPAAKVVQPSVITHEVETRNVELGTGERLEVEVQVEYDTVESGKVEDRPTANNTEKRVDFY